jgi:DNA-binding NarL/FixJ family response regulator
MTRVVSTILNTGADRLLSAANLNQQYSLTDPEAQILRCLKAGKERSTIAAAIGADEVAVKEHIKAILRKAIGSQGERPYPMRNFDLVPEASYPVAEP